MLHGLVVGHLVLVAAALLGEGADALVDPFVAVDLALFGRRWAGWDGAIDVLLYTLLACLINVTLKILGEVSYLDRWRDWCGLELNILQGKE